MKHKISKMKIAKGVDANTMLLKKLVRNFVEHGHITTTQTKAQYLVATINSLANKALSYNEAVKNTLLPFLRDEKAVLAFVEEVKQRASGTTGSGIVSSKKLGARVGDAAPQVKVSWTKSIESLKENSTKKAPSKS